MSDLVCPFCHTQVPVGAIVCRGCQAEVHYNHRKYGFWVYLLVLLFVSPIFVGILGGTLGKIIIMLLGKEIGGLIFGIIAIISLFLPLYFLYRMDKPQTVFKRLHNTR